MEGRHPALERLEVLVGAWDLAAAGAPWTPDSTMGRVTFEWMPGGRFLVQRWTIRVPEAPDGLAVIGLDREEEHFLQHYFDERGVARVYAMRLGDGRWELSRTEEDFSPLGFWQRFTGTFSADGSAIDGRWEIAHEPPEFELDFELSYRRV